MPPTTAAKTRSKLQPVRGSPRRYSIGADCAVHLQSNPVSNAELTPGGRHMAPKRKGRKSKRGKGQGRKREGRKREGRKREGRKREGRKRKSEWWSENFFAIRDLIWAIYFRIEEPDPAKPSLDDLFRK